MQLAYVQGELSNATPTIESGIELATKRCQRWGYTDAEAFGGETRKCVNPSKVLRNYCVNYQISREFQCTGGQAGMPVYVQPVYMQPVQPQQYQQQQYQQGY